MDFDRYRHNFEGFIKNLHAKYLNREKITTQGAHAPLLIILFSFSLGKEV